MYLYKAHLIVFVETAQEESPQHIQECLEEASGCFLHREGGPIVMTDAYMASVEELEGGHDER